MLHGDELETFCESCKIDERLRGSCRVIYEASHGVSTVAHS